MKSQRVDALYRFRAISRSRKPDDALMGIEIAVRQQRPGEERVPKKIRRVVTGHNEEGKSVIISDDPSPHVLALPGVEDFALTNLWVTDGSPADNAGRADAACRPVVLEPPPGGTIFRIVEFPRIRASASTSTARPSSTQWLPAVRWTRTLPGIRGCTRRRRWTTRLCCPVRSTRSWTKAKRCCGPATLGPARHQPRLEQSQRNAVLGGVHPGQREPCLTGVSGSSTSQQRPACLPCDRPLRTQ